MLDLFEFETAEVASESGAAASPEHGESVPPADATPAAPEAPVWESPEFQEAVAQQAAEIADARFAQWQQSQRGTPEATPPAPTTAAPPFPDQYSENYGQEMAAYLAWRDEQLVSRIEQKIQPVTESLTMAQQAAEQEQNEAWLQDVMSDAIMRGGDMNESAKALVRPLAESLMFDITQRYGPGRRSVEMAIEKAVSVVRNTLAEASKTAATQEINRIGTLGALKGDLPSGVTGVSGLEPATLGARELAQKYGARARAHTANGSE